MPLYPQARRVERAAVASMNICSPPLVDFKTEALADQAEHRRLFRFEPDQLVAQTRSQPDETRSLRWSRRGLIVG
jgi:hypothetical protein